MTKKIDKILKHCFDSSSLKNVKESKKNAEKHIIKAHNNLRAMHLMYDNDLFDWTVACGYYAMYHAVLASLINIGIKAKTHYCAVAAFKKFYVDRNKINSEYIQYIERANKLDKKYAESLDSAKENRIKHQYGIQQITNDDAEWILEEAQDFVLKIEEIIA